MALLGFRIGGHFFNVGADLGSTNGGQIDPLLAVGGRSVEGQRAVRAAVGDQPVAGR
jgi:hypothetical protein